MANYAISFARAARKELEALDAKIVNRIVSKIAGLEENPRPAGCRKIVGEVDLWRIRVGDYRIVYRVNDPKKVVDILAVRHRSTASE